MFVKLGQVAATRTDLLPAPLIAELSQLQSSVTPAEPAAMREVVEAELGCPAEEVFASFDWKPLAAASIAHVYRATLSGEPVAVKVQRPQVAEIVARDTQAMLTLASFIQRRTAIGLRVDVLAFVHEFTDAINEELDFAHEARATERIRTNRLDDKGIHIPRVHMDLCTRRLIVMEEVHGRPVSDPAALAASPVPPQELADRLLASYLGQIFRDGAFHADPHPGNILLDKAGTLHLLDFGSTGILDAATLDALGTILVAIAMNAPELFQRAILDLAPPPSGADLTGLSSDLTRFLAVHQHGGGFDAGMLKAMIDVLQRHRLAIPTSLTLLSRAVLTLDGTLHIVAPGYPLADRATEIAKPLLVPFEPTEQGIQRELLRTLPALRNLPSHAEAIATQVRSGQLTVRTRSFADPADAAFFRSLVNRALLAAIGLVGILTAAIILLASSTSSNQGDARVLEGIGYAGLFLGSVITMRVVALIVRDRSA